MANVTKKLSILLIFIIGWEISKVLAKASVYENQVIKNIESLSRNNVKNSEVLQTLPVNDLRNILRSTEKDDCAAKASVKVDTLNCECKRFSCSARRFANSTKRSRFLIARSCEDICCRKRILSKKSTQSSEDNFVNNHHQCDVVNATNDFPIKSIVQIYSLNVKKCICLGSLIHPKAVLTTLECITTHAKDDIFVKMKETLDTYQNLYQVRNVTEIILPDNNIDRIEKQRFNMVLLLLNKEMEINNQIGISCLPKNQEPVQSLVNRKCFVISLEYVNGRLVERNESIHIFKTEQCREYFDQQNRFQMFSSKQNICAGILNGQSMHINSNGASLICIHQQNENGPTRQVHVLYGLLSSTNNSMNHNDIRSQRLFTNINNYRYWIEKKLKKYT